MSKIYKATDEFECPVCGELNSLSAERCIKCNTYFGERIVNREDKITVTLKIPPRPVRKLLRSEEFEQMDASKKKLYESLKERKQQAIEEFMLLPGMIRANAELLYDLGFQSLSDIFQYAFHGDEDALLKSNFIVDRLKFLTIKKEVEGQYEKELTKCVKCGREAPFTQKVCRICGETLPKPIKIEEVEDVGLVISEYIGDLFTAITEDKNIQALPDDLKSEIMNVLFDEEYKSQKKKEKIREQLFKKIENWRKKGCNEERLKKLEEFAMNNDLEAFKKEATVMLSERIEKLKIKKRTETEEYRCPDCNAILNINKEKCDNCGCEFIVVEESTKLKIEN